MNSFDVFKNINFKNIRYVAVGLESILRGFRSGPELGIIRIIDNFESLENINILKGSRD